MRQCKCGCCEFCVPVTREIETTGIVHFNKSGESEITSVCDGGLSVAVRYGGPFVCTVCGHVYQTEEDIPGCAAEVLSVDGIREISEEAMDRLFDAWEGTCDDDGVSEDIETGLFLCESRNDADGSVIYTGADNTDGEMFMEDFRTREGCIAWLNGVNIEDIRSAEEKEGA